MKPPYPAPVTEWHNDTYDAINPKRAELSQAGKNIAITGAGSGIGREITHAFAEAGAGSIHILGRKKDLLEETQASVEAKYPNAKVVVHVADILDATALSLAARDIGNWDVLVANAGYIPKPDFIETSDPDEWWKTFEVLPLCILYMISAANSSCVRLISKGTTHWLARLSHTRKKVAQSLRTRADLLSCPPDFLFSQRIRHIQHQN